MSESGDGVALPLTSTAGVVGLTHEGGSAYKVDYLGQKIC